jgi:hypothetical protein
MINFLGWCVVVYFVWQIIIFFLGLIVENLQMSIKLKKQSHHHSEDD